MQNPRKIAGEKLKHLKTGNAATLFLNKILGERSTLDMSLLFEALTTPQAAEALASGSTDIKGNGDLAKLGDAVLECILTKNLLHHSKKESELERFKTRKNLGTVASRYGFKKVIVHTDMSFPAVCAEALEAFIGAIYQKNGFEAAETVALKMMNLPKAQQGAAVNPSAEQAASFNLQKIQSVLNRRLNREAVPLFQVALTPPGSAIKPDNSDLVFEGGPILRLALVEFFLERKDLDYRLLTKFFKDDHLAEAFSNAMQLDEAIISKAARKPDAHARSAIVKALIKALHVDAELQLRSSGTGVPLNAVKKFVSTFIIPGHLRKAPESKSALELARERSEAFDANVAAFQEEILHVEFKHLLLLKMAFTTETASRHLANAPDCSLLETLGDAVIGAVVADIIKERGDAFDALVQNETLAKIAEKLKPESIDARKISFSDMIIHADVKPPDNKRLADSFEALVGAIYLECGHEKAREFVLWAFKGRMPSAQPFESVPTEISPAIAQSLEQKLPELEKRIGHAFVNKKFILQALVHGSVHEGLNQSDLVWKGNHTAKFGFMLHMIDQIGGENMRTVEGLKKFAAQVSSTDAVKSVYFLYDIYRDKAMMEASVGKLGLKDVIVTGREVKVTDRMEVDTAVAIGQAIYEDVRASSGDEATAMAAAKKFLRDKIIAPIAESAATRVEQKMQSGTSGNVTALYAVKQKLEHWHQQRIILKYTPTTQGSLHGVVAEISHEDETPFFKAGKPIPSFKSKAEAMEAAAEQALKMLQQDRINNDDNPYAKNVREILAKKAKGKKTTEIQR